MADDKKNIPDTGKVDEPPQAGKGGACQSRFPGAGSARPGQGGGSRDRRCVQGGNAPYGGKTR